MKTKEKSIIIAQRIRLGYGSSIAVFVVLQLFLIFFTVVFALCKIFPVALIIGCLIIAFSLLFAFDIKNKYINNHLPNIIITQKGNKFFIHDPVENLEINKSDIINVNYKNKTSFIILPNFYSATKWNYGKLILKDPESSDSCYKLTLDNVAYPDKVYEKLYSILELDVISE